MALLLAAPPVLADGTPDPDRPVFFRVPDPATSIRIREAVNSFGSPSPSIREKARDDLSDIGYWSVGRLIEATQTMGQQHRSNAILVLGRLGDPRALAPLREAVRDESSEWPPVIAALMLGRMKDADDRTMAAFRDALGSREKESKRKVAVALALAKLARRRGPDSAALLDQILDKPTPNPFVHYAALLALGFHRSRVAEATADGTGYAPTKLLRDALTAPREGTRLSAVLALALSRLDGLDPVFLVAFETDGDPEVRRAALMALGKPREMPDAPTTDLLCRVLQNNSSNQVERETAAYLLALRRDPRSFDALYAMANSNRSTDLAAAAVVALGGLEDRKVPDLLVAKLGHPSATVRAAAGVAAVRLGGTADLQRLREAIARRVQRGEDDTGARTDLRLAVEEIGRILKDREDAAAGRPVAARAPPGWKEAESAGLFFRLGRSHRQALLDLANLRVAQVLGIDSLFEYRPSGEPVPTGSGSGSLEGGSRFRREGVKLFEPYDLSVEFRHRPFFTLEDDPEEARPALPRTGR